MTDKKETVGDIRMTRALKEGMVLASLDFVIAKKGTLVIFKTVLKYLSY